MLLLLLLNTTNCCVISGSQRSSLSPASAVSIVHVGLGASDLADADWRRALIAANESSRLQMQMQNYSRNHIGVFKSAPRTQVSAVA